MLLVHSPCHVLLTSQFSHCPFPLKYFLLPKSGNQIFFESTEVYQPSLSLGLNRLKCLVCFCSLVLTLSAGTPSKQTFLVHSGKQAIVKQLFRSSPVVTVALSFYCLLMPECTMNRDRKLCVPGENSFQATGLSLPHPDCIYKISGSDGQNIFQI